MAEFVLEVGCEELPAHGIEAAARYLASELERRLRSERISCNEPEWLGTPRRLLVRVPEIAERQTDAVERKRGPAVAAAYDHSGAPTKALEGFCRGQGVAIDEVENDGEYVWVNKTRVGCDTAQVLANLLPSLLGDIPWSKTMRWGTQRERFARPVRWLVALLNGQVVGFSWAGVTSGDQSRGHRFEAPEPFRVTGWDQLLSELRARKVEPDPAVRMSRVRDGALAVASGKPDLSDALVYENAYLTEWPEALQGEFDEEFLDLPEPVLITTMAKHERFFPVRDDTGRITNRFVSIRNGGREPDVRQGNEWVLRARFNDARFFYREDSRYTLDDFLARTENMTFQEKLGSVRARADRLASLAEYIGQEIGGEQEARLARIAGLYAKADLSSGLVGELDELQGQVGGHYAAREGRPLEVVHAIGTHYDPGANLGCDTCAKRVGAAVTLADQMDKLAGYLGIGRVPTGSSDPAGLRRAVNIVIDLVASQPRPVRLDAWLAQAAKEYEQQGVSLNSEEAKHHLWSLLEQRFRTRYDETPADQLDAALVGDAVFDPHAIDFRIGVASRVAADTALREALSRPINIALAAEKKGITPSAPFDPVAAQSEAAIRLSEAALASFAKAQEHVGRDAEAWVAAIRPLQQPIHAFFDTTMVMDNDDTVRNARLALMFTIARQLSQGADFTKLAG